MRLPWPLRRRIDPASAQRAEPPPGAAASDPRPADDSGVEGVSIDPGFAEGFRSRAEARDATPILGPWGGLAKTARFAVSATHFQDTLVTQRFSDDVPAPEIALNADASGFLASLHALASYDDPTGSTGESGSPFADLLPVARGDLFAPAAAPPAAPAFPARRPPPPVRPDGGRVTRPPDARPATPPRASTPIRRTTDVSATASRPRGVVTESPPPSQVGGSPSGPAAEAPLAFADEDVAPVAHHPAPDAMPLLSAAEQTAPGSPPPDPATAAPSLPAPAPGPSVQREPDLAAGAPETAFVPPAEPPLSLTGAEHDISSTSPAERQASPPADLPLAREAQSGALGPESESTPPLPQVSAPLVARSAEPPPAGPLPLAMERAEGIAGARPHAAPPTHETSPEAPLQDAIEPAPLLQREVTAPLGAEADTMPRELDAPAPLGRRVARFSVGEPIPVDLPFARNARDAASSAGDRASELPRTIRRTPEVSPGADASLVSPQHRSPLEASPDEAQLQPAVFAPQGPELPLVAPVVPRAPVARKAGDSSVAAPAAPIARRTTDRTAMPVTPLLYREPPPAPLGIERTPAAPRRSPAASPAVEAPSGAEARSPAAGARDLPLASLPPGSSEASGTATPAGRSPWLPAASARAGVAPSPSASPAFVWRAADADAPAAQGSGEAASASTPEAAGTLVAAPAPPPADADLDKLTEKVWQRIRRTLQLERERRRGLP